eukprot:1195240-Prorocentrum_minimum.AAC.2
MDVKGYCVDVKGYCVDGKGYYVDVKGYCVDVKGYCVDVKDYCVDVKGYCVDVKDYCVDVKGYYVDVKGYYVDVKDYCVQAQAESGAQKEAGTPQMRSVMACDISVTLTYWGVESTLTVIGTGGPAPLSARGFGTDADCLGAGFLGTGFLGAGFGKGCLELEVDVLTRDGTPVPVPSRETLVPL